VGRESSDEQEQGEGGGGLRSKSEEEKVWRMLSRSEGGKGGRVLSGSDA
jgi:hypothetical protein